MVTCDFYSSSSAWHQPNGLAAKAMSRYASGRTLNERHLQMVAHPPTPPSAEIFYPEANGQPMADNTAQFRWIVTIKENLEILFAADPTVFIAGDLLWYPVEGSNRLSQAPDTMVVFGRPKGESPEATLCDRVFGVSLPAA